MKIKALLYFFLIFLLTGCFSENIPDSEKTPTFSPVSQVSVTPTAVSTPLITPFPSPTTIVPDSGWINTKPGLENRILNLIGPQNMVIESMFILRINPSFYDFEVHHQTRPLSLEDWAMQTNADIVVNAGYFLLEQENYYPTGLAISNGEVFGLSYGEFAGMFTVAQGFPDLRWLEEKPYDSSEPLDFAIQSFPLLVKPGGELGFPAEFEDNLKARRTVLAKDQDGNFLLILTQKGYFTLHTLSMFLTGSDLNLDIAVNLDGGPSTGLLILDPYFKIPSGILLPFVLTVHQK
ncbi:MAG: hypothetical protein CL609_14870 [Anaerolineaceae bacterium]|nr:hypothetical protein [Anaerolineaceae bacterium]